jgi:hypothetical protein
VKRDVAPVGYPLYDESTGEDVPWSRAATPPLLRGRKQERR